MSDEGEPTDPQDPEAANWVAFLDGEADESTLQQLRARLAGDPVLRARLDALRAARPRLQKSFDALLNEAPVARMQARLRRAVDVERSKTPSLVRWRMAAAVVLVALVFAAGFVTARWSGGEDEWRGAVADYMELYVPETLRASDPGALPRDISSLADWLGLPLDSDRLGVAGLGPRRVEAFEYQGAALGQVGYLDSGVPIAFCIIRKDEGDAPIVSSVRNGFAAASWAKGGHGFMVIGKRPPGRIAEIADQLQRRF